MSVIGRGRGKLILCGEHAVVYGHPALAMAVDRGTTVTLTARPGPTLPAGPFAAGDARLPLALRAVLPDEGFEAHIASDLPVGRGMGSSAALAIALVRAAAALDGRDPGFDELFERGFAVERVFHGNPSGIDHAVSAHGGLVRYRRPVGRASVPATPTAPTLEPLPRPAWTLVVLDSGVAGDTREMVAGVAARRPAVDADLDRIGRLVDEAAHVLDDIDALGHILNENHARLRQIGVSTPGLDDLVRLALDAGASGAKLAGAGGGGVVIALAHDPARVLAAAHRRGVAAFPVQVA